MRFLALLILFFSLGLHAHQTSLTPSGSELVWLNPVLPVIVSTNSRRLSAATVNSIIDSSFNEWNSTSSVHLQSSAGGNNAIRFSQDFSIYGSAVIGVTELSYNESGSIHGGTVLLNEQNFNFTDTPSLMMGSYVFLGDVVTHELGHLLGMAHSETLDSSMFYASYSGQSSLSSDDKAGIRQKYDSHAYGQISGHVEGGKNIGILGVNVQAISRKTGDAISAISDENGYFLLGGLDLNDTYYLYTSPIKNPESLPGYFSNLQSEFCPASYVGSFFSACGKAYEGMPQGISLSDSVTNVDVGIVTINCSLKANAAYGVEKLHTPFQAVPIFNYNLENRYEKAFVGYFRKTLLDTAFSSPDLLTVDLSQFTSLGGTVKYLKVAIISQPLGSQVEYQLSAKKNGSALTGFPLGKTLRLGDNTYDLDIETFIQLDAPASTNMFQLEISGKKLTNTLLTQTFPASKQFSNATDWPYLVIVSLWESTGAGLVPILDTNPNLSDNASCLDAPFTYAVAKKTPGAKGSVEDSNAPIAAACGTIDPPSRGGPGSMLGLLTLGFVMSLLASKLAKRAKNFLS